MRKTNRRKERKKKSQKLTEDGKVNTLLEEGCSFVCPGLFNVSSEKYWKMCLYSNKQARQSPDPAPSHCFHVALDHHR